jgi:Uma2 family endonuclease
MSTAASVSRHSQNNKMFIRFNGWELRHTSPRMNDEEFEAFCRENPGLRIEQDQFGNLSIMPPVSYESGNNESEPLIDLGLWNRKTKLGKVFSPSTMFTLPDGSKRMPDAAWVSLEKDALLSAKERKKFARIVPDFVIELRSPSDDIEALKDKMREVWIANGVRLGWLIDPEHQHAYVFRADGSAEILRDFDQKISGEQVLPGFEFDLSVFI